MTIDKYLSFDTGPKYTRVPPPCSSHAVSIITTTEALPLFAAEVLALIILSADKSLFSILAWLLAYQPSDGEVLVSEKKKL